MSKISESLHKKSHIYHYTNISHLAEILKSGIQPLHTHRDSLDQELATVAGKSGIDCPIDRENCVFFYPWVPKRYKERRFESDEAKLTLGNSREVILVVDAELIECELYVADFKLYSDAIDHQYVNEPDDVMISESKEDALRRYAETLSRVESIENLYEICSRFYQPEVILERTVPTDTIVNCVLNDKHFTRILT